MQKAKLLGKVQKVELKNALYIFRCNFELCYFNFEFAFTSISTASLFPSSMSN